jgi:hypothetical protein
VLGEDLVLAGEFLFEKGDLLVQGRAGPFGGRAERGSAVLKQLLV